MTGKSAERVSALGPAVIAVAVLVAYHNSFSGPFVFDDPSSIVANPTLRHLWPPWDALIPPNASVTVQGRPLLNFSFALNYAISGTNVWSYHALNVAIHLAAALALFGVVRRTLMQRILQARWGAAAGPLAMGVAVLWAVHPLQTESVSYTVQRAESLMGFFFLFTFYAFVRYSEEGVSGKRAPLRAQGKIGSPPPGEAPRIFPWGALSLIACALGAATKEVVAVAPLLVLLYDRTFVGGSFREAWRRHGRVHALLCATWLGLAALVFGAGGNRGGSFAADVWWTYPLTQFEAITRYLGLAFWPHPLVFEYGTHWVTGTAEIGRWAPLVLVLLVATVIALRRQPMVGFLGGWFFAILAPTSLMPGTTQMIVEHRMYLSLAAVIVIVVLALHSWLRARSLFVVAGLGVVLGWMTIQRNDVYRTEAGLWRDTVVRRPENSLAHQMLAMALERTGDVAGARAQYELALQLKPNFALAHDCLGQLLYRSGEKAVATEHFESALRLQPEFADAHDHLAVALGEQHRLTDAVVHGEAAVRLRPDFPEAHLHLANLLADAGRPAEAIAHYEQTLRLRPAQATAHYNLGNTLALSGRAAEAVPHYEAALALRPDYADACNNLGAALLELGRRDEAIARFEQALRLDPGFSDTRALLARLRAANSPAIR